MQDTWWQSLVQWTLWGAAMALVMGWVGRNRLKPRPEAEAQLLRHPISTLVIGVIGAVFFFGLAIISNTVGKNPTATVWTTLCFISLGLMSAPMILDYIYGRHQVSEDAIAYGRLLGRRGVMRWADVRRIRFSPGMKWFVLEDHQRTRVRVSAMLMGLPEFARLALAGVPPEALDDRTRTLLTETSLGRPPRVWG
ncbi:PH domain-containing protein [Roseateles sp. 22389]|uniref:PH domain-containing protein n=1 Tax=Roseateles sp. 22389 TaxID=3453916 RepID=UPI003F86AFB0